MWVWAQVLRTKKSQMVLLIATRIMFLILLRAIVTIVVEYNYTEDHHIDHVRKCYIIAELMVSHAMETYVLKRRMLRGKRNSTFGLPRLDATRGVQEQQSTKISKSVP